MLEIVLTFLKPIFQGAITQCLSPIIQVIIDKFSSNSNPLRAISTFCSGKLEKLEEELESKLDSIKQVLDDAEEKQYKNPNVKKWLSDVKHAMYEADQLLDEIATDASLKKFRAESQPSTSNSLKFIPTFDYQFESRIIELINSLDSLSEQKDGLGLENINCSLNEVLVNPKPKERETSSIVDASKVFGRDNEKDEMIKILLSNDGIDNQTPIISIVGLGGIGKTTFAKLVFNDSRIDEHFQVKAWVYVSKSFDVIGLTKAILKSFDFPADDESIIDILQRRLQQKLTGKKYLLVLDDIWNGNEERWEQLLLPFNHGSSGSKIIVTTRNNEVACVLNSSKLFDLQQLDKSDCWSLFVSHAFHGKNMCEYPNLESIGKDILYKCGGLPLAVKTLGQLLRKKFSQHEWNKILDTEMWRLPDNNINPVLILSYHNLSFNQKRCFAYCSIFPKGYRFVKGELINCWRVEGLLSCAIDKSEEELGNEFFCDLESISFFQQSLYYGKYYFVMHDLVNDLAKSVLGEFGIQIDGARVEGIHERTRHIWCSLQLNCDDKILKSICELKGLRSLILRGNKITLKSNNVQHDLFSRLKCLRMLSFRYCDLSELDKELKNLNLLRYLDLSYTMITSLPDSICELYNLQTLLLEYCQLTELPSDFSKLINLRHLELLFPQIRKMPQHMGKLKNLHTLPYFIVKEHNRSELKELGKLNNLHGTIDIEGLGNVIDPLDVATTILKDKKYLQSVKMKFDGGIREMNGSLVGNVLEALQPNNNLKRLTIEEYKGKRFPNWLQGDHLPNLVYLELVNCRFSSLLPPLWKLPSLKKLYISNCGGIKIIDKKSYDNDSTIVPFKSLVILNFESLHDWEEWNCSPKGFPLLKFLTINNCAKLKRGLPQHLPSLERLSISDCKELEVSIPKGSNIIEIDLWGCDSILVNELPSTLKRFNLRKTRLVEFSADQNVFNNVILDRLDLTYGYSSIYFSQNSGTMSICIWKSLPFSIHSITNLHSLELSFRGQLKSFPIGGLPPNLSELEIKDCPELESFPPEGLPPNLNKLEIKDCRELESFPPEGLPPNLSELKIEDCPKLKSFPPEGLPPNLNNLHITNCPELESFPPVGLPPNLRKLKIENCHKLIGPRGGLFQLNSLKELKVRDNFENVESFPEEGLLPPTLETLHLYYCTKLRRINYKGLLHLKSLIISDCICLERLPEEGLPNSISFLEIYQCPKLEKLYRKEKGELWHTISHIYSVNMLSEEESFKLYVLDNLSDYGYYDDDDSPRLKAMFDESWAIISRFQEF